MTMLLPLDTGFSSTQRDCCSPFLLNRSPSWLQRFLLLLHLLDGRFAPEPPPFAPLKALSQSLRTNLTAFFASISLSCLAHFFHMTLLARFVVFESMNFCTAFSP